MVRGIDIFKEFFKYFTDNYIIIGGTACDILIKEAGFSPRVTKDIDIILIVEALSKEFVVQFWEFIKKGNYEQREKGEGDHNYYRFIKPENKEFPYQIELFAKNPDLLDLDEESHLTPIPTDAELSSLSAILMDEKYYKFTLDNSEVKDEVNIANTIALICLKAQALLDYTQRSLEGEIDCSKQIKKHKADMLRLTLLLVPGEKIEIPDVINENLKSCLEIMAKEPPGKEMFKSMGITISPDKVIGQFKEFFEL
ncbi:hypothetical protein K5X82_07025 [Halosquirtibacter xylanolyticus]|uniref:hypothetical protein n=1 Tax=Halosquirtibacter xylanolyticus TaxID=3374599 RepID=UPI0037494695|nr:hypothetical protein K5X82_07025 [Prolixibacteraceae bacterium]